MSGSGFSLVELTVVLIIVGILAAVALPKLTGQQEFQTYGFFGSAQSAVRYAQKLAVAQRRSVYIVVAASSIRLCYDAACGSAVVDPVRNAPFVLTSPSGVTVAGANLAFDGLGRPNSGAAFAISDSDGSRTFLVEPETGYVHP